MKNQISAIFIMTMALCASGAQSQSSSLPALPPEGTDHQEIITSDTLRITPAMIEEMRGEHPVEEFEREIESVVFVPKGQWVPSLAISYNQSNQNNYQFFVLEGISGDTYTFKVTPGVCYIFKDDMGAGLKFAYTRSLAKLENADIVLGSESSYAADHVYSLSQNYYATMFYRNYFSIGRSKRFGFFNEIQCQLGGGQSKFTKGVSNDLTGSYETNFSLNVGIVPGLCVFLNNYSAVEVNVGVLGFSYTRTKTLTDRIYVSRRNSKSANFRLNLFSITFGVAFYL